MRTANDALSAMFLADDPDEVLAAAAAVEALSSGLVHKSEGVRFRSGQPKRGGLFCARIFGPVDEGRCLCGKLSAPAFAGQICDKCGVLCGSPRVRGERWGHVESAVGLVHPCLVSRIAGRLGCTARELQSLAAHEATIDEDGRVVETEYKYNGGAHGLLAIAERLGDDARALLLTRVAVTPAAWRGTRRDPQDAAYAGFINRCNRLRRLIGLNAPDVILDNERRMSQQAFERLYAAVRAELAARGPVVVATDAPRSEALLQAVYDAPDSDDARRAYAAHLTAEGDLYGEFIARQLAGAGRARLGRREADLLRRDFDRYLAPLKGAIEPAGVGFRRGFLSSCKAAPGAALCLEAPAWSTVERLETDLPDLVRSPALRSLVHLVIPFRTWHALCLAEAELPRVHTLRLAISHCPPRHVDDMRDRDVFPGLRDLTVSYGSPRGTADWAWLAEGRLARDVERLSIITSLEGLAELDLPWWVRLLADRPRLGALTLSFGKGHFTFELRGRGGHCALRANMSRLATELITLSTDPELLRQFTTALTALAPNDITSVHVECRDSWFGEELGGAARALRDHFGDGIAMPNVEGGLRPMHKPGWG